MQKVRREKWSWVLLSGLLLGAAPAAAQKIRLKKFTNGQDADAPPGPILAIGAPVTWTYVVTNTGGRPVINLVVTDDQGVAVSCPATTLDAGNSLTCTATGTAQPGQYANVGTATAELANGDSASASDPSHYFGHPLRLEKSTNGQDADLPPGPVVAVGSTVTWTYVVTNLGAAPLANVSVTDDQGVTVTCPATTVAGNASMTCTASGTAVAGQYANVGTVTADDATVGPLSASDPSHYFGQDPVLSPTEIPALGDWGLMALLLLLAGVGLRKIRGG